MTPTSTPPSPAAAGSGTTMTRRTMLRRIGLGAAAVGGVAVIGGVTVSKVSGGSGGTGADLTIRVGGTPTAQPFPMMPTAAAQAAEPEAKAYAAVLDAWLQKNPGVKLEHINFDTSNTEALVAAVGGGTAPDVFIGNVLGSWSLPGVRRGFSQGLAADVSEVADKYRWGDKLKDSIKPAWDFWNMDGKRYGLPYEYSGAGQGIYYRRDLIEKAGLKVPADLPAAEWNWDYVATLAKALTNGTRRGFAAFNWNLWMPLNAGGHGVLVETPDPGSKWNWRWDYQSNLAHWESIIAGYRKMMFTDKSMFADVSYAGNPNAIIDAFRTGKAAMMTGNTVFYTNPPSDPSSFAAMAVKAGLEMEEMIGWMPAPNGPGAYTEVNDRLSYAQLSFRPDLDPETLDKAVELHTYLMGEGLVQQMELVYDAKKDLKSVYRAPSTNMIQSHTLMTVFRDTESGLPGTPEEAWGKQPIAAIKRGDSTPIAPLREQYFPDESNPAPPGKANDDAINNWAYAKNVDVRASLLALENTRNKQAAGFGARVDDKTFTDSARRYYTDLDAFLVKTYPDFHAEFFAPWYRSAVQPKLA